MINQLKEKKQKDLNYVRELVLLILDSTNDLNTRKSYNKKVITSFRKRLYANYDYFLKYCLEHKKDYLNDDLINDVLEYCVKLLLTNNETLYNIYLKKFDYINDDDIYDYHFKNDVNIIKLKKQFYRSIYHIAYYFFKVLPKKDKVNP